MNTVLRIIVFVLVCFSLTVTAGCAKKQQVKKEYSGFLTTYPKFEPGPEGGAKEVYLKEGVNFKKYNKVMMEKVVFYLSHDAEYKGIDPDDLKKLADAFHEAVTEALGSAYPLVDTLGPDVMRIRLAITNMEPSKPGLNLVVTAMPGGFGVKALKQVATGSHSFIGDTSMEAEILDSLTNERIAAVIDSREKGDKFRVTEGLTRWGDVKDVFKFWAKRIRMWLDETHGVKKEG